MNLHTSDHSGKKTREKINFCLLMYYCASNNCFNNKNKHFSMELLITLFSLAVFVKHLSIFMKEINRRDGNKNVKIRSHNVEIFFYAIINEFFFLINR